MTLPVYAMVGHSFQSVGDAVCPEGFIEMQGYRPDSDDYTAQADGTWAITEDTLQAKAAAIEAIWRDGDPTVATPGELAFIAEQLLMLEDNDPSAEPGTADQWRAYRVQVRAWKDGAPNYPDRAYRPVRPA
ncbi:hypothetical protein QZH45_11420 [Pseudomonas corrugata]|uniref:hypothetical protein n=1 Tax=Pseudomonas corrugata TaxID=47879 RepID=UPI0006D8BE71|nr:hypothetical protein [Pseudomonas corrugata]